MGQLRDQQIGQGVHSRRYCLDATAGAATPRFRHILWGCVWASLSVGFAIVAFLLVR